MTTFDLAEVRGIVADLDARMARCQGGAGMDCATRDDALRHHAQLCREITDGIRAWGREIFAGRVAHDPGVEAEWLTEGRRLYARAMELRAIGQDAESSGSILDGQDALARNPWNLDRLLRSWVTPKLSVGPSARDGLVPDPAAAEAARRRIASMPPLPADWIPDDPQQQTLYRMLRSS